MGIQTELSQPSERNKKPETYLYLHHETLVYWLSRRMMLVLLPHKVKCMTYEVDNGEITGRPSELQD